MVWGHVCSFAETSGIDSAFISRCMLFSSLYICFFMQAFLVLTGYTSNFNKSFKDFFLSLIKTILIPWVSFSFISQIIRMFNGGTLCITISNQEFFFLIEDFWFLHVLFFGKLIYYFIYKYIKNDSLRAGLLLSFMACGFFLFSLHKSMENTYHYNNYLHFKDLLCMMFFIWMGNYLRRKNMMQAIKGKSLIIIMFLYLLGHLLRLFFRLKGYDELLIAPVIISHGGNAISPLQIPAYLYYVILGSLTCFGLIRYIEKCALLEYFGRNSLVIYCMHFLFISFAINIVKSLLLPISFPGTIVFVICSLGIVLLSCSVIIYLSKYKPFSFLIGKF